MKETTKWAHYLPSAVMAMNISETTKFSLFELIHGVTMREVIVLQIEQYKQKVTKDQQMTSDYWRTELRKIISLARDRLYKSKTL